jgi:hypothetical protein
MRPKIRTRCWRSSALEDGDLVAVHYQQEIQSAMSTTKKTSRIVQPYLFFDGRCDEAIDFYRKALDAEVTTLLRF